VSVPAALSVGLVTTLLASSPRPLAAATTTAPTGADPTASRDDLTAARAAVAAARKAASAGDWATALARFEEAYALRPATKLHHSLAVCHHRLASQLAGEAQTRHRGAAIVEYEAYLREAPEAPDRGEVEAAIRELGGTTGGDEGMPHVDPDARRPGDYSDLWKDVPGTDPVPQPAAEPPPPAGPVAAPVAPTPAARVVSEPQLPRGRIGVAIVTAVLHPLRTLASDRLDAPILGGLMLHGAGHVGARKRVAVGAEALLVGMLPFRPTRYGLAYAHLAATVDARFPVGKRQRWELQIGGHLGLAVESLRERSEPANPVSCGAATRDPKEASARLGGTLGARAGVAVLLGRRRRNAIGLRVTPSLLGFGGGRTDASCDPPISPFREVGLRGPVAFGLFTDLGWSFRF
jgi:hypothetical protein